MENAHSLSGMVLMTSQWFKKHTLVLGLWARKAIKPQLLPITLSLGSWTFAESFSGTVEPSVWNWITLACGASSKDPFTVVLSGSITSLMVWVGITQLTTSTGPCTVSVSLTYPWLLWSSGTTILTSASTLREWQLKLNSPSKWVDFTLCVETNKKGSWSNFLLFSSMPGGAPSRSI